MAEATVGSDWHLQKRPPALTRRFSFASYSATRDFLDALAEWSEGNNHYPDLSFGTTYVNVTLALAGDTPNAEEHARSAAIAVIANGMDSS